MSRRSALLKRLIDVVGSAAALILLSPVLFMAAVAVRLALGSPVIFRQVRPGLHGRPFVLYKFRSMRDARNASGEELPDAERLTGFGQLLRSTSIDELPELFNVLRGDMSLVGPRPLLMRYLDRYTPSQAKRQAVKPGLTGWSQVRGRNALSWEEKFALDTWYVDNASLLLDLKILAVTLPAVICRRGISQPGHATMDEFRGCDGHL